MGSPLVGGPIHVLVARVNLIPLRRQDIQCSTPEVSKILGPLERTTEATSRGWTSSDATWSASSSGLAAVVSVRPLRRRLARQQPDHHPDQEEANTQDKAVRQDAPPTTTSSTGS